jgi:hypothetical protein
MGGGAVTVLAALGAPSPDLGAGSEATPLATVLPAGAGVSAPDRAALPVPDRAAGSLATVLLPLLGGSLAAVLLPLLGGSLAGFALPSAFGAPAPSSLARSALNPPPLGPALTALPALPAAEPAGGSPIPPDLLHEPATSSAPRTATRETIPISITPEKTASDDPS